MFRLASFFAVACLTLAATALLTAPKRLAEEQPPRENDSDAESSNRLPAVTAERAVPFHARFSLN